MILIFQDQILKALCRKLQISTRKGSVSNINEQLKCDIITRNALKVKKGQQKAKEPLAQWKVLILQP